LIAKQVLFATTLGKCFGINARDILPTPGATGAIEAIRNHVYRATGKTRPTLLTVCPGYWRARESFSGFGFEVRSFHTRAIGFTIDERSFVVEAQNAGADLIYLSLPNNPTGAMFSPDAIIDGMRPDTPIALDMTLPARGLDTGELTARLYNKFYGRRNLFLVGSTSKSHATAEYRVGWLICAHSDDAAVLKEENRNVVSCVAIDRALDAIHRPPSVFDVVDESFFILEQGERVGALHVIRPDSRVQTGYVLIKHRVSPAELRDTLDKHDIRVMWGSEFGLDDEYIRLETLEPSNIKVFVEVLGAALDERR
jgi:aspartate/methionine/tyrosine aminotransferase